MATVPTLNLSKIGAPSAPAQRSVAQAGAEYAEIARIGQTISETGQRVGSIVERRRAEEARDVINTRTTEDRIISLDEMDRVKEEFNDSPKGASDTLEKQQKKRHDKILKGIEDPAVKRELGDKFSLQRLQSKLMMQGFERKRVLEISADNVGTTNQAMADSYYDTPPSVEHFSLDMREADADIMTRDFSNELINKLHSTAMTARTRGAINGHLKGGSIQDFKRARQILETASPYLNEKQRKSFNNSIDQEILRQMNIKVNNERKIRKQTEKQFLQEQRQISTILDTVIDNPNADVSDQVRRAHSLGWVEVKDSNVTSSKSMSPEQNQISLELKHSLLERTLDTDNPAALRGSVYEKAFKGEMSAEHAKDVLTSIRVQVDSGFKKEEFRFANTLLSNAYSQGRGWNRFTDKVKLNVAIKKREELIDRFGIDPVTASNVILKEEGRMSMGRSRPVFGLKSDQSSVQGIAEAKKELANLYMGKDSDEEKQEFLRKMRRLNEREKAIKQSGLENIPTIEELEQRTRR